MTRRTAAGAALPGLDDPDEGKGYGPLYQSVAEQIRALFPAPKARGHLARCVCEECEDVAARKARYAGTIGQARSLAASIDRASGHAGGRQASGVQLSAMHDSLDRLLARLDPDGGSDEFADLLQQMRDAEEAGRGSATAPSHAEE